MDIKNMLRNTLENLTSTEFKKFKHHLKDEGKIPRGKLEESDGYVTLDLIEEAYTVKDFDKVVLRILKAINLNQQAMQLEKKLDAFCSLQRQEVKPFCQDDRKLPLKNGASPCPSSINMYFFSNLNIHMGRESCNYLKERKDEQAEQHQEVVSALQNQLVHKVVECKLCLSSQQSMKEQTEQHKEEVSALQNQLETLKIEKCVANSCSVHSESFPDPCRASELVTMYRELKTQVWGGTKEKMTKFGFDQKQKDMTKNLIKETFEKGKNNMLSKRQEKDIMLKQISGIPHTVKKNISPYIQYSIKNLMMFFFLHFQNIKKTSDFKTFVKMKNPGLHEVVHELYVHCYFVSRLMELHDPPIELCWDRTGVNAFPDPK